MKSPKEPLALTALLAKRAGRMFPDFDNSQLRIGTTCGQNSGQMAQIWAMVDGVDRVREGVNKVKKGVDRVREGANKLMGRIR